MSTYQLYVNEMVVRIVVEIQLHIDMICNLKFNLHATGGGVGAEIAGTAT